jgi:hypothetical protein
VAAGPAGGGRQNRQAMVQLLSRTHFRHKTRTKQTVYITSDGLATEQYLLHLQRLVRDHGWGGEDESRDLTLGAGGFRLEAQVLNEDLGLFS